MVVLCNGRVLQRTLRVMINFWRVSTTPPVGRLEVYDLLQYCKYSLFFSGKQEQKLDPHLDNLEGCQGSSNVNRGSKWPR